MQIGKIPPQILEKIILDPIRLNPLKREEIIVRPKTGEDASAIDLKEEYCVVSTDPITAASIDSGYLAVHINCNDVVSSGAEPIGILLTILLPENTEESILEELMDGAYRAAKEADIEILGGHTEVTKAVNQPIVCGTVLGKTRGKNFISSSGAQIGQDVVMTKWAGLEGTCILAREKEKELKPFIKEELLLRAKELQGFLSVIKEGKIGAIFGVTAMHDATEGGVLGAVWEVADCSSTGIEIELSKIPVKLETLEICRLCKIDPYRLISSGTMILTCFHAEELVTKLQQEGVEAAIIGKITDGQKWMIKDGIKLPLTPPESDELYHAHIDTK